VRFGMVPELGQVAYETEAATFLAGQVPGSWRPRSYGEGTADLIDRAVQKLIDDAFQAALAILTRNRAILDAGARELLERETLAQEDLAKLTAGLKRVAAPRPAAAE
jgi:cell division protease FtsH